MDYQSRFTIELVAPKERSVCEYPEIPEQENREYPIALLAEKGDCTYISKAKNGHKLGARVVFVSLRDPNEDPEEIIPIAPKKQSVDVPPVVVISKKSGDEIREVLSRGERIFLSVDFDLVTNRIKISKKDMMLLLMSKFGLNC